ncbi:hypothetical protein NKR19_g4530 [Coniochaeta hoffmannii]|uniref:Uncharacterized protein n=1 Tax=Coniochaeta hoffmannii TaxID=91930 RepID=A0AA38RX13_9PEZI|nr:hypothetical protein NKR19_g4530 [Coniochaeta hoffmannii]
MANPTTAAPEQPRRRFAPVPIETTFEQYRKPGPVPEPTPSPSSRSESPPAKIDYVEPRGRRQKRRFAPQLVESSVRRSRRAGDEGPATRPTDKTDITPYTNHIYAPKTRRRHGRSRLDEERRAALARRESQDDEVAGGVFERSAREAQRKVQEEKIQELALSAFPNSGIRIGGAEHYVMREGSEDDSIPSRGRTTVRFQGPYRPSRRNSSEEDISWAFKEMQEHASRVKRNRSHAGLERISTLDLDNMSIDSPPSDAMGLTRNQRQSMSGSPSWSRRRSSSLDIIGEHHMPYIPPEAPLPTIGEHYMPYVPPESPPIRPIGETFMPYIPSAPAGKAGNMPYIPASDIPAETGFRHANHSPAPYDSYSQQRDPSLERLRNQHHVNRRNSPPMLGADLSFRRCPSPKHTKLEPDHLWDLEKGTTAEEPNRDHTGEQGLWRGYCYNPEGTTQLAGFDRPQMIQTPQPLLTPGDPFARAFSMSEVNAALTDTADSGAPRLHNHSAYSTMSLEKKKRHEKKGIHMLQGLDERLAKEKAAAELDERIAAEFDDQFVTQVYNYLSLGYPAMARAYDEELSKISKMPVEALEQDDDAIMDSLWGVGAGNGSVQIGDEVSERPEPIKKVKATGHIMLDSEEHDGVKEEDRCPRWKALKKYIHEWARQHPDLEAISPLAWGMQERRGSWGV